MKNKKALIVLVLLMLACLCLTGCKDKEEDKDKDNNKTEESAGKTTDESVDILALKDVMLTADDTLPEMSLACSKDENAADLFSYLADFEYERVDSYFFAYASLGTAEEVAVIRLKDKDYASDCLDAVKEHVKSRKIQFETYDPTQVHLCEDAIVFSNENYVVLIMAEKDDAIKTAFYDAFK